MSKKNNKLIKKSRKKLWKNIKAHSTKSRKNMKDKHGSNCFLDPKNLKYPICNKFTGKQECIGLNAANYYLNLNIGRLTKKMKQNKTQKKTSKLSKDDKQIINNKFKNYYSLKSKSKKIRQHLGC